MLGEGKLLFFDVNQLTCFLENIILANHCLFNQDYDSKLLDTDYDNMFKFDQETDEIFDSFSTNLGDSSKNLFK